MTKLVGSVIYSLRHAFRLRGRASRFEFASFSLFGGVLIVAVAAVRGANALAELDYLVALISLVLAVPSITVSVRRFHDAGFSGWWAWATLVPILGWLLVAVLLFLPSDEPNRWGAYPEEPSMVAL